MGRKEARPGLEFRCDSKPRSGAQKHLPQVDTLGRGRQDVRGPPEEAQAREEDELVFGDGDHRSEIALLVGSRQDQGMAGQAGHGYRALTYRKKYSLSMCFDKHG